MRKFIVAVFPNEAAAYDGTRAFQDLDNEGSITLYGITVLARDAQGKLTTKKAADQGPLGFAVGTLAGGLIGLIGGPVGAAIGMGSGAVIGSVGDMYTLGVSSDFVQTAAEAIMPGKAAVIADVDEEWVTPLDTRMEVLGAIVVREGRAEVEDNFYTRDVESLKAEVAELKAEYAQAKEENKARLKARIDAAQARLQSAKERAQAWLQLQKEETEARAQAIHVQAVKARDERKAMLEQRIHTVRENHKRRSEKLSQAWELTKEAFRPAA